MLDTRSWEQLTASLETPCFLFDQRQLENSLKRVRSAADQAGARLLYSLKACSHACALEVLAKGVDGFACSSLYEAQWARSFARADQTVHWTSPCLRPADVTSLGQACDYVSLNSVSLCQRHAADWDAAMRVGLRINPACSFVEDDRYNPCRPHSKLGVPLDEAGDFLRTTSGQAPVDGLHFHSNCDSDNFKNLLITVRWVIESLGDLLEPMSWINLGGGYLFERGDVSALVEAVDLLKSRFDLEVFLEPGAAFVRDSVYLVSRVVDLLEREGRHLAVLDTSINHLPEVFEYQFEPDLVGDKPEGEYEYCLAGATCLAGDLLGRLGCDEPLEVGQPVIFKNIGAYSQVKANLFNGIGLPCVYSLDATGSVSLHRRASYQDFLSLNSKLEN